MSTPLSQEHRESLERVAAYIQWQRENGETDLRATLYAVRQELLGESCAEEEE